MGQAFMVKKNGMGNKRGWSIGVVGDTIEIPSDFKESTLYAFSSILTNEIKHIEERSKENPDDDWGGWSEITEATPFYYFRIKKEDIDPKETQIINLGYYTEYEIPITESSVTDPTHERIETTQTVVSNVETNFIIVEKQEVN